VPMKDLLDCSNTWNTSEHLTCYNYSYIFYVTNVAKCKCYHRYNCKKVYVHFVILGML